MIKALGEDAKKINAKVGSIIADSWADKAGKTNNTAEFAQSFENYLKDVLEFADHVKVKCDDKNYTLDICGIEQAEEFETDNEFTYLRDRQSAAPVDPKRLQRRVGVLEYPHRPGAWDQPR